MQLCSSLRILWHCLSLGLEWKLTFSSPVATAEFSKFAGILSAALSQHHLSGFEIAQLHQYLILRYLLTTEKNRYEPLKSLTHFKSLPITPICPLKPLKNINLLSVSTDLSSVDISCKWYYIICDILCLVPFIWHMLLSFILIALI